MVYLDNAATTFKKPKTVYEAVNKCIKKLSANAGRGGYTLSLDAAEKIYETREEIAAFLNFSYPERVVFTVNATHALNLAIKGVIKEKCHVIISDIEHNSVTRPIQKLHDEIGVEYSVFNTDAEDLKSEIESHVKQDTKVIVSTLASNVTGKEIPLEMLSKVARERNLKLIIDASQYIGHKKIDLESTPCDALCAPAHKALFGIMGLGFAVFSQKIDVEPLLEGGSGSFSKSLYMPAYLPERLEAGTLPLPAIASLYEGIRYIKSIGIVNVEKRLQELTDLCCEAILSVSDNVIYGKNLGIICFNTRDIKSEDMCARLNSFDICVRGGLHCAPTAHKKLNTYEFGAVRVSLSYFTKKQDIYSLYRALKKSQKLT